MTLLVGFALVNPKLPVSGMKDKDADVIHLSVMIKTNKVMKRVTNILINYRNKHTYSCQSMKSITTFDSLMVFLGKNRE